MPLSKIQKEGKQFQCFVTTEEYIEIKNAMMRGRFNSQRDLVVKVSKLINSGDMDGLLKKYFGQGFDR